MEGQARVLEQRIEAAALERRRVEPRERVRGEQQEGIEAERRAPPARRAWRSACVRRAAARTGPATAPATREHRHPEQHRAFVIAPGAGEFVEPRLGAMAVLGDQLDRQVGAQEHQRSAPRRRSRSARPAPPRRRGRARQRLDSCADARAPAAAGAAASAAASHSAARPASAITSRPSSTACSRPGCRSAAACSARHAWRGSCRRRTCRRPELSFGDDPAAFAEQIGRDAAEADRDVAPRRR